MSGICLLPTTQLCNCMPLHSCQVPPLSYLTSPYVPTVTRTMNHRLPTTTLTSLALVRDPLLRERRRRARRRPARRRLHRHRRRRRRRRRRPPPTPPTPRPFPLGALHRRPLPSCLRKIWRLVRKRMNSLGDHSTNTTPLPLPLPLTHTGTPTHRHAHTPKQQTLRRCGATAGGIRLCLHPP